LKAEAISPKGLQIAQVVLGVIAIGLSLSVMAEPGAGVALLVFLLSITLLVLGIERVIAGIGLAGLRKSSRIGNIILGGLTIALGIVVISFPLFAAGFLILMLAIGLLFMGIARILYGITASRHNASMVKVICNRCRYIVNSHIIYGVCIAITWRVPFDINIGN